MSSGEVVLSEQRQKENPQNSDLGMSETFSKLPAVGSAFALLHHLMCVHHLT